MRRDKKIGILVILALLSISNASFAEDTIDFGLAQDVSFEKIKANKDTISKAQEAIENKDYSTAITLLTAYINEKPKKYEIYKLRGDAYYALRRYDLAQKDYNAAIDIKANEDKFMTNTKYVSAIVLGADKKEQLQNAELGDLYGALMYAQKAQNDQNYLLSYENAVKYNSHIYLPQPNKRDINRVNCPQKYGKVLNPQGVDAQIYGAVDDIEKGNYNEALYKLQSVTAKYPNYYMGYYLTGVALAELEKDSEAIQSFEKAVSLNPYDFESYASLGQVYYSKAETTFLDADAKKSIEYFNKALKLNKNCPTYYFYIGMNELQAGNTSVAVSNFDKALKINPEDYNSAYYKLIAQYMKGDYQDVIDGTSKLIQKHVSNYNSVLYLRALTYTQLNDADNALEDLNSIENNIEDIYNTDIKKISDREKSLESYVHYLKAQVQHLKGAGAAEDDSKAYVNPIIDRLANAKKAIEPYEKSLQGDNISLDDYKKFESFYTTSLPKLLESGAVITYDDIDNQYDYIRTTFDDLGISFLYMNPDYKMTTIKDYPYKKYGVKLNSSQGEFEAAGIYDTSEIENVELAKAQKDALKKTTPASELLAQEGQVSIAQMLAFNALGQSGEKSVTNPEKSNQQFKPEVPAAENTDSSKNIASGENREMQKSLINSDNTQKVQDILKEEESMNSVPVIRGSNETPAPEAVNDGNVKISSVKSNQSEPIKVTAKEIKQTDNIEIKYSDVKPVTDIVASANAAATSAATTANNVINTANTASGEIKKTGDDLNNSSKEAKRLAKERLKEEKRAAKQAQKEAEEQLKEITANTAKTQNKVAENVTSAGTNLASAAAVRQSAARAVKIKHANLNQDQSFAINANDAGDVVELKTSENSQKISNDSDLFNEKTVFTRPDANVDNLTPSIVLPEEPVNIEKQASSQNEVKVQQESNSQPEIQQESEQVNQDIMVINTPEITVPEENIKTPDANDSKEMTNISLNEVAQVQEQDSYNNDDQYVTKKLSEVLDQMAPKQAPDNNKTDIEIASEEFALQKTISEVEDLKLQRAKLKEEAEQIKNKKQEEVQRLKEAAKMQKQQQKEAALQAKEAARLEKQQQKEAAFKLKEEAKLKKEQAKAEAKQIKINAKQQKEAEQQKLKEKAELQKEQIKAEALKTKEEAKLEKQKLKTEQQKLKQEAKQAKAAAAEKIKLEKIQAKAEQKKDEVKINQLKSKMLQEKSNSSETVQKTKKEKLSFKEKIQQFKSKLKSSKKETNTESVKGSKKVIKQIDSKTKEAEQ